MMTYPGQYGSHDPVAPSTTEYAGSATLHRIFLLLRTTYGIVPIVAGLDKFTDILTNWDAYLNPRLAALLPFSAHTFMLIAGVVEIAAGALVFARPRFGAYVVTAWLVSIALSLIAAGNYFDVAVRDLVMAIGAYCLGNLAPLSTARHD